MNMCSQLKVIFSELRKCVFAWLLYYCSQITVAHIISGILIKRVTFLIPVIFGANQLKYQLLQTQT